jgi:single-strand DNA-binding protein
MANDVALVTLTGRLAADPDMKYTQAGMAITNVNFANGKSRLVDGEWVENTSWYRLTGFGKVGEKLGTKFGKGDEVLVTGEQEIKKSTGRDGKEWTNVEVVISSVRGIGAKKSASGSGTSSQNDEQLDPWSEEE